MKKKVCPCCAAATQGRSQVLKTIEQTIKQLYSIICNKHTFVLYTTVVYSLQHLGEKIWFVDCFGAKNIGQFLP